MKLSHKFLFFLNSFVTGILAPFLALVLLRHGATLQTLSVCIGIFSTIVVVMEPPSGILTDLYGRKRIFLFSHLFMLTNFILIMLSHQLALLAIACVFHGLGRAFSSGTIETLEIESHIREHGIESLSEINSLLTILESFGLAAGALCSGFIGYMDPSYTMLLLTCVFIEIMMLILTLLIVKETREQQPAGKLRHRLAAQIRNLQTTLLNSRIVISLLIISMLLGLGLSTVEIYWQPTLELFLPENLGWIFGMISCLGYFGISMGNKGAEWLWRRLKLSQNMKLSIRYYWPLRFLLPIFMVALGFCTNLFLFLFFYITIYTLIGAGNLFENTLFHSLIDNTNRSSMLSLSSLFLRSGGIITSVLGSFILTDFHLPAVWIILPAVMWIGTFTVMLCFSKKNLS